MINLPGAQLTWKESVDSLTTEQFCTGSGLPRRKQNKNKLKIIHLFPWLTIMSLLLLNLLHNEEYSSG